MYIILAKRPKSSLLQGIDFPRVLEDPQGSESRYVVYRFYSDKAKTDQALEAIRKVKPLASIRIF